MRDPPALGVSAAVAAVEQSRGVEIAQVDAFSVFDQIAAQGLVVPGGSSPGGSFVIDNTYLGGLFSLDGIHPTRTGQAVIANAFIDAINTRFGESIPRVDIATVAASDPFVGNPYRPQGEPPFGLIEDESPDVRDALDRGAHRGTDLAQVPDVGLDLADADPAVLAQVGPDVVLGDAVARKAVSDP